MQIDVFKIKAEYYLDNCSLRSKKQKKKKKLKEPKFYTVTFR